MDNHFKLENVDFYNLFYQNPAMQCLIDERGVFLHTNLLWEKNFSDILGDLPEKSLYVNLHPEEKSNLESAIQYVFYQKETTNIICRYQLQKQIRYLDYKLSPFQDKILVFGQDITIQKQFELKYKLLDLQLNTIMDSVPNYIYATDEKGILTFANRSVLSVLDKDYHQINELNRSMLFEDHKYLESHLITDQDIYSGKINYIILEEELFIDKEKQGWFQTIKVPFYKNIEDQKSILHVSTNISDLVKTKKALKDSNYYQEMLFNNIEMGVVIIDAQSHRIENINEKGSKMIGLPNEYIVGKICSNFICPANMGHCPISDYGMEIDNSDRFLKNCQGEMIPILKSVKKIFIEGRLKYLETFIDITDRRMVEEALIESNNQFQSLVSNIPGVTYRCEMDDHWTMLFMSDTIEELTGYNCFDFLNNRVRTYESIIHPEDRAFVAESVKKSIDQDESWEIEYRIICKDQSVKWVFEKGIAKNHNHLESILLDGFILDITDRKNMENELIVKEENFRQFFNTLSDLVLIADSHGKICYLNDSVLNTLGYAEETLINCPIFDLFADKEQTEIYNLLPSVLEANNFSGLFQLKNKENTTVPVESRFYKGIWDNKTVVYIISKNLSSELEALNKFNALFNNSPAMMVITSYPENKIIDINNSFIEMTGYGYGEVVLNSFDSINLFEDRDNYDDIYEQIISKGSVHNREIKVMIKSGEILDCLYSGVIINNQGKKMLISLLANISDQKKAERMAIQANNAKSEFLANMSHEIRTPLNGVIGFIDLLSETELSDIQKQYLSNAKISSFSLLEIINDILDLSKIEAGKLEIVEEKTKFPEFLSQIIKMFQLSCNQKGLQFNVNTSIPLPEYLVIDSIRVKQILCNLLSNAIKFTKSGNIEFNIYFEVIDPVQNISLIDFSVKDSGIGISEDQMDRLFKAFSQADSSITKQFGGTGLGLVISNLLAKKMGSQINVLSKVNEGSTFSFSLVKSFEDTILIPKLDHRNLTVLKDDSKLDLVLMNVIELASFNLNVLNHGDIDKISKVLSDSTDFLILDINNQAITEMMNENICILIQKYYKKGMIILNSSHDEAILGRCPHLQKFPIIKKPYLYTDVLKAFDIYNEIDQKSEDDFVDKKENPLKNKVIRVLIIEDVPLNLTLLKTIIKMNYPKSIIADAENGQIGVELAKVFNPDIIFMDIQMPVMDGYTACKLIREKETQNYIPIIALTAGTIKGEKEKCLSAGMDDFLSKPVIKTELLRVIDKYLCDLIDKQEEEEPPISSEYLTFDQNRFMEQISNDNEVLRDLVSFAYDQLEIEMNLLRKYVDEGQIEQIKGSAHKLKGTSLNMCFNQLGHIFKEIQEKYEDQSLIRQLFDKSQIEFKNLKEAIKHIIDKK